MIAKLVRSLAALGAGLVLAAGLAVPAQAHPVPYCSNYLQGALSYNASLNVWASPYRTSPANSVCWDIHVQHVTLANWAPPSQSFQVRVRIQQPGGNTYTGDWITFPSDCYECSKRVTTGAWGGLTHREEFRSNEFFATITRPGGVYFYGAD